MHSHSHVHELLWDQGQNNYLVLVSSLELPGGGETFKRKVSPKSPVLEGNSGTWPLPLPLSGHNLFCRSIPTGCAILPRTQKQEDQPVTYWNTQTMRQINFFCL